MRSHSTPFGDRLFGLHWSSSLGSIHQVIGFYCKGCQGCTCGICLDFVVRGYQGYLQEFWTLDLVKHGSTGEVKDDGNHGKEGGEIGYRQLSSHYGRGWSYRPSLW